MKKLICLLLLAYESCLLATQELPWIDTVLQPVAQLSYTFQHFNRLSKGHGSCSYPGDSFFLTGGLFFASSPEFQAEIEICLSATPHHSFDFDHLKQTAKYAPFDDSQGDLLSLALGLSLQENWSRAVKDISVIAHAKMEGELFLSIGKEWSEEAYWCHRLWGLTALGIGEQGSPWMRGLVRSSHNLWQFLALSIQLEGQIGLGGKSLSPCRFAGYGPIAYRFIDLSLLSSYQTDSGLLLEWQLLQRLYSRNSPKALQQLCFGFSYPFNL